MSCRFVERKVGSTLIAVAVTALVLLASVTAQAATNCDAPIGALVHGASTSVTDSTTTPTLTGGSATATCNNGTLVYTSASCVPGCGATTVNWGAGCTASAAAILSGASSNLTNTNPAYGGTVTSSCTNGVRASSSAVCNANCTIPAGQTWVVGANTCTNPTLFTIAHGANGSGTDATQPTTGTGTWSCTNGSATLQGTSTCYAQCAAQAVNWSQAASNCTGTSAVLSHGASSTVADGTAPATGNVNITCNNGTLNQSSPVCDGTNSCAAGTVNWTAGGRSCSDTVVAGVHGNTQALADTTANIAPGGTGTATATCSNGSWVASSPVCNASCGTQTVNWTLTSNNCDASSGAILTHGGTRTITDAAAPTTGTRDIGCNNGTVTQSGGTCVAGPCEADGNWTALGNPIALASITSSGSYDVGEMSATRVVLESESNSNDIRAYNFANPNWSATGTLGALSGDDFQGVLQINSTDYVFIEQEDQSGTVNDDIRLHIRRWDGSNWSTPAGDRNTGLANQPSQSRLNSNTIAVIGKHDNDMEAWMWNGTAWTELGKINYPNSGARYILLEVAYLSNNQLLVHEQYHNGTTSGNHFLSTYTWNGTTFVLGTRYYIAPTGVDNRLHSIIGLSPTSILGKRMIGSNQYLVVYRWNGTTWVSSALENMGTENITFGRMDSNTIAVTHGNVGGAYRLQTYRSGCE